MPIMIKKFVARSHSAQCEDVKECTGCSQSLPINLSPISPQESCGLEDNWNEGKVDSFTGKSFVASDPNNPFEESKKSSDQSMESLPEVQRRIVTSGKTLPVSIPEQDSNSVSDLSSETSLQTGNASGQSPDWDKLKKSPQTYGMCRLCGVNPYRTFRLCGDCLDIYDRWLQYSYDEGYTSLTITNNDEGYASDN